MLELDTTKASASQGFTDDAEGLFVDEPFPQVDVQAVPGLYDLATDIVVACVVARRVAELDALSAGWDIGKNTVDVAWAVGKHLE